MKLSIWIALACALACGSFATERQDAAARREPAPGNQLDFWVGDWDLTYRMRAAPGKDEWKEGRCRNSIRRVLDGKVILEQFDDPSPDGSGLAGMSLSVYDAASGVWRQTWVDNQSSYMDFVGGFEDGTMRFTMERTVGGAKRLSRMVFDRIEKDSFDWTWMHSTDGGKSWVDNWIIHYRRRRS